MGVYQSICYKVEDLFVKVLTKKQDAAIVKEKVEQYRTEKQGLRQQIKLEKEQFKTQG